MIIFSTNSAYKFIRARTTDSQITDIRYRRCNIVFWKGPKFTLRAFQHRCHLTSSTIFGTCFSCLACKTSRDHFRISVNLNISQFVTAQWEDSQWCKGREIAEQSGHCEIREDHLSQDEFPFIIQRIRLLLRRLESHRQSCVRWT
jgi:hypothetical protein